MVWLNAPKFAHAVRSLAQQVVRPLLRKPVVSAVVCGSRFVGVTPPVASIMRVADLLPIHQFANIKPLHVAGFELISAQANRSSSDENGGHSFDWTSLVKSTLAAASAFAVVTATLTTDTTHSHCVGANEVPVKIEAKIGAGLFVLWGILHLWVPCEGFRVLLSSGIQGAWHMMTGGSAVPHGTYKLSTDAPSILAQTKLFSNFIIDVGGYGLLGFFVAYGLWTGQSPWFAYLIGLFCIGVADLAFLFNMVTPGVIELNAGTVGGPVIWFLAILITPLGLTWPA